MEKQSLKAKEDLRDVEFESEFERVINKLTSSVILNKKIANKILGKTLELYQYRSDETLGYDEPRKDGNIIGKLEWIEYFLDDTNILLGQIEQGLYKVI